MHERCWSRRSFTRSQIDWLSSWVKARRDGIGATWLKASVSRLLTLLDAAIRGLSEHTLTDPTRQNKHLVRVFGRGEAFRAEPFHLDEDSFQYVVAWESVFLLGREARIICV